jgi:hypothetical protein
LIEKSLTASATIVPFIGIDPITESHEGKDVAEFTKALKPYSLAVGIKGDMKKMEMAYSPKGSFFSLVPQDPFFFSKSSEVPDVIPVMCCRKVHH